MKYFIPNKIKKYWYNPFIRTEKEDIVYWYVWTKKRTRSMEKIDYKGDRFYKKVSRTQFFKNLKAGKLYFRLLNI